MRSMNSSDTSVRRVTGKIRPRSSTSMRYSSVCSAVAGLRAILRSTSSVTPERASPSRVSASSLNSAARRTSRVVRGSRSEEHTSELQSRGHLVCRLLLEKKNIPLIKYSIEQILMSKKDKVEELRRFVPSAEMEDWDVVVAGKRVQVMKDVRKINRVSIDF